MKFPTKKLLYLHLRDASKYAASVLTIDEEHFILPGLRHCSLGFLQQLLCKQKQHLTLEKVMFRRAPKWPELAAKRLIEICAGSPSIMAYLPDWRVGKAAPDRDFIWTVIHHVSPQFGKNLMREAQRIRAKLAEAMQKKERPTLNLPAAVIEELLNDEALHCKSKAIGLCIIIIYSHPQGKDQHPCFRSDAAADRVQEAV
jgi:hypothetical protein